MTNRLFAASTRILVALGLLTSLSACRGLEPPYSPDSPPQSVALMAASGRTLDAIQVPRAKIREGKGPAATLMIAAQSPARFSGTIQISGNEMVTLAVNEDEYALRWLAPARASAGALKAGYYSGPPSRCAVETLLGVDLEPKALVELVLGGAPLIAGPHNVGEQRWDKKRGRELLTIDNGDVQQELAFAWEDEAWRFAGATLWVLKDGGEAGWLWTIEHIDFHEVDGVTLPAKTQIRTPSGKKNGEVTLNVTYVKQNPKPAFAASLSEDPPPDGDPNAGDTWDEDEWEDDGWDEEDDGGGGGDVAAPAPVPPPDARAEASQEPPPEGAVPPEGSAPPEDDRRVPREPAVDEPITKPKAPIPPAFVGNPTGLKDRGDLCRGRR